MEVDYYSEDFASDSDNENKTPTLTQRGRKNIRDIKELEDLNVNTRLANKDENERIDRLAKRQKEFQDALIGEDDENELILDYDFENNIPLVSVHKTLTSQLKPHQKDGVRFMWNSCFESLKQIKTSLGSGCILAHCMGLGKTFQVITLAHTLLSHKQIGTDTILICCPKNTVLNWMNEFKKWITPDLGLINVFNPTRYENHTMRLEEITKWQLKGGVCLINYELLRILLEDDDKETKQFPLRQKMRFNEYLCNPGPDLVICDEGHVLKNVETKLSKVMSRIRTLRRIVLTGTPMQNNLKEYHCMVHFVKPNLLGTRKEFLNMFVNPILNGQYENSLVADVQLMKERSHVLHKKLSGCVQRFDLTTLKKYLPDKQEYVISITLTDSQIRMYRHYLENYSGKRETDWKRRSFALFADHQALQRILTHPYTLKVYEEKHEEERLKRGKLKKSKKKKKRSRDEDYDFEEDMSDSEFNIRSKCPLTWWVLFMSSEDIQDARQSNKLVLLLKILQECEDAGEKILVFSSSLYSLGMIEHFLKRINRSEFEDPSLCNMTSSWEVGEDYLVLTGDTSSEDRDRYCKSFNNVHDTRLRLFLISTKAGGVGINLTAANRAIIFDVSWNPSHDIQSIFRIYRIGQMKPCFVYRFVASGTMEEKIYERQVAKQSISYRVVDEKQIARHYTQRELLELYQFEPNKRNKITNVEPKDPFLQKVLKDEMRCVNGIHEHDSLLEHKEEEELEEVEKNDAWTAYNNVNDFESLPSTIKTMLKKLKPEDFDPDCLRKVIERKYKDIPQEKVTDMVDELMPRIQEILSSPNFLDVMTQEALKMYNKHPQNFDSLKMKTKKLDGTIILSEENFDFNWDELIDFMPPSPNHYENSPPQNLDDYRRSPQNLDNYRSSLQNLDDNSLPQNLDDKSPPQSYNDKTPSPRVNNASSDSEDSVFRYILSAKKRARSKGRRSFRKKPINAWGANNGKKFGTPDIN